MKLLVFGGNGQVGRELLHALAPLGEVVATARSGVLNNGQRCETADFYQPTQLPELLERIRPDWVVNAAAYTAVDLAEQEREAAFCANADAPGVIARWCAAQGVPLVHYSTDYVFAGDAARPYLETDATAPLGAYGASKLAGEEAVRGSGARHVLLRTAWVYAAHGKNFLRTMLRLANERDTLRVVADQIGTPTPAPLIAKATASVIAQGGECSGTWHLTASGATSWHGFAEAIMAEGVAQGVLAKAPRIEPITTAQYPTPARRPAWSVLDNHQFQQEFGVTLPDWRQGLSGVIADIARSPLP